MKYYLKILLCVISISLVLGGFSTEEAYGKYPEKMITMIVPFKAGGGGDRWSRVLSTKAIDYFGQPWHVVNFPGAAALVGWKELLTWVGAYSRIKTNYHALCRPSVEAKRGQLELRKGA